MFNTKEELVKYIIQQFQYCDSLGCLDSSSSTPVYSHLQSSNKIGCAIGCILDDDEAEKLQNYCNKVDIYRISELLHYDKNVTDNIPVALSLVENYINFDNISFQDLQDIQEIHDNCVLLKQSVQSFIVRLQEEYNV